MCKEWVMQVLAQPSAQAVADTEMWLAGYDLDAFDGIGSAWMTTDISEAMRFDSSLEVLETWNRRGTVMPVRPDGKPNKPLTALTIAPMKVPS